MGDIVRLDDYRRGPGGAGEKGDGDGKPTPRSILKTVRLARGPAAASPPERVDPAGERVTRFTLRVVDPEERERTERMAKVLTDGIRAQARRQAEAIRRASQALEDPPGKPEGPAPVDS